MFQRTAFGKCCLLLVLTIAFGQCCAAAPRVFIDSRSTTRDPNDIYCGLMLRELPRQALIVALSDDLGVACLDATMQPDATAKPDDIVIGIDRRVDARKRLVTITLYDSHNNVLDSSEIPI